jgi:ubiquinone/menaquinone biosynthesis C-methylase UbiE
MDMQEYYARRADEYERIYARPERQGELALLHSAIEQAFAGCRVLDVACGTGYFTRSAARQARSVTGIDASAETLAIARAKGIGNAEFAIADAYALPKPSDPYDAALISFWWSHIPRLRVEEFLLGLHRQLAPGARVLIADNTYVEGSSTPITRADAAGDTYQLRILENGARYEVLKNFPTRAELIAWGERFGTAVDVRFLTYYWILQYRLR